MKNLLRRTARPYILVVFDEMRSSYDLSVDPSNQKSHYVPASRSEWRSQPAHGLDVGQVQPPIRCRRVPVMGIRLLMSADGSLPEGFYQQRN